MRSKPGGGDVAGRKTHPTPAARAADPPPRGEGASRLVLVGEFGRPHGVRGEIRLKSFTAEPEGIARYEPLTTADGSRSFVLRHVRPAGGAAKDMFVVKVAGVESREAAEALNRVGLYVPRGRLAADLDEEEFLQADLIGLAALAEDGTRLGTVIAFHDFGAGDIVEIAAAEGGATALLPFTKKFVPVVAVDQGHVVVAAQDIFAADGDGPDADDRSGE
ncbi:ribosome maturation factor RimM [Chelatococcus sp. GCM10030263]|uniref:ribosome maturation factor RimM n=1 Tax=Chelatococcus sp. GCM10030263 TaxID=3273387 RepID=UPI003619BAA1